ncbi:MAG: O-antigen ligase family protein, partial [Nanoarchaeota archaeon]
MFDKILMFLIIILLFFTPISRSGLNIFAFFILVIWISKKIVCPWTRKYNINKLKWLFGYSLLILLSTINAVDKYEAISTFVSVYLKYIIIFLVVIEVVKKKKQINKLLITFLISSLLVYIYAFYQYFNYNFRIYSTLHNPNPFGTYLTMVIFFSFCFAHYSDNLIYKIFGYIYGGIGGFLLIISYSRGAWLGFIFGIIAIILYLSYIDGKINFRKSMLVFLISLLLIGILLPDNVIARFNSIFDLEGNSIKYRLMQYQSAIEMIKDKPLLGHGLGQYPKIFPRYKPDISRVHLHVHNLYLHWLVETGILGFLGLIVVVYKVISFKFLFKDNLE